MYKCILPVLLVSSVLSLCLSVEAQQPPTPEPLPNCQILQTKPSPKVATYNFTSCIVVQFAGSIQVGPNQFIEIVNGTVDQSSSHCDNSTTKVEPKLTVDFSCGSLTFNIGHNNDSETFVSSIQAQYRLNNSTTTLVNNTQLFSTSLSGHYYKCNSEQNITLASNLAPASNVSLLLSNLAIEAYRTVPGTDFYKIQEDCPQDSQQPSDLVRIGVGVSLVALVAVVLIAYFIGRRRWSERSSYESV